MSLLVGMVVGLIVLGGVSLIYLNATRANLTLMQDSRSNQELKAIMDMMVRDIRRAGGSPAAVGCIGNASCADPFSDGGEDWEVTASSIAFTYDADRDDTQDADECQGFRRVAEDGIGRIEIKTACTPSWQSLTSAGNSTNISNLAFTSETRCLSAGSRRLVVRKVRIYLEGQSAGVTHRMCQTVRVKNNAIAIASACDETDFSTSAPFDTCPE